MKCNVLFISPGLLLLAKLFKCCYVLIFSPSVLSEVLLMQVMHVEGVKVLDCIFPSCQRTGGESEEKGRRTVNQKALKIFDPAAVLVLVFRAVMKGNLHGNFSK